MKDQEISFFGSDMITRAESAKNDKPKIFDWDKAAAIIKAKLKEDPNIVAEAGLEGDWSYTGGCIFSEGKPVNDSYTYLYSRWAIPTLVINDSESFECYTDDNSRFDEKSKWDEVSLAILNND